MADTEIEGSDLSAIIADELRQAQTFDQTKRSLALEYMRGEMRDLPARVNGSSQTSRDVADTLSWVLPGIVRVFTASDQMVEFEATQEGGEQGAEEASEYTNYSFFRENDGYRILYNATHDGLLMGNGAACSYWCPEESKNKLFRNKTMEEIAVLTEEEGWTSTGVVKPGKPKVVTVDDPDFGEVEVEVPTLTVKLKKVSERGYVKDMTLKPDNLWLNLSATSIGDRFTGYLHDDKTRSDLMAMADEYGWDTEVIQNLPRYTAPQSGEVAQSRRRIDYVVNDTAPTKSGDLIDLYECYVRVDRDGDGEAELLQVWYAGNAGQGAVLSEEEWEDDVPFTDIPCYPVPHQWQAEGLYDRLADVQRVKTALLRQGLDNTYASGMPMREVEVGSVENPDILVNPKFGGLIWKKKGTMPIVPHETPYTADKSFAAMQMMDEIITKRTGVSKATMALDPEALQNQTATASQNQRDAGYSQIELIARNMAELGWAKFFAKRRNLAKKYIKGPIAIPSKNGDAPPMMEGQEAPAGKPSGYRTIQPEAWGDDMACTINVGLGTGSRDRDMAMLNTVLQTQIGMTDRLAATGFSAEALDFIPKIIKTATQIAESAGMKNPDSYYPQLDEDAVAKMKEKAAQPKPNPKIEEIQATGEVQKGLKEVDAQVSMKQAEIKAQGDIVKNRAELEADLQTKAADRENAVTLETLKQSHEDRRFFADLAQKRELELAKLSATEVEDSEPGPDGKPKKTGKKRIVDNSQAIMEQMAQVMQAIAASQNSSVEIIRGPDGRATGARKVMN